MKAVDLKKKKDADLVKLLKETQEKAREIRFGMSAGSTSNTSEAGLLRRDIARILTELNSRRA